MNLRASSKILASMLALILVVTSFSLGVYAEGTEPEASPVIEGGQTGAVDEIQPPEDVAAEVLPNLGNLEQPVAPPELDVGAAPDIEIAEMPDSTIRMPLEVDMNDLKALFGDTAQSGSYQARRNMRPSDGLADRALTQGTVYRGIYDLNGVEMNMTLAKEGSHCYVLTDYSLANSSTYNAQAAEIANEIDSVFEMLTASGSNTYISNLWFYDDVTAGQDIKVMVLLYDIPIGDSSGYVAGLFNPNDFMPSATSNFNPTIHIDIGTNEGHSVYTDTSTRQEWFGTIAHEMQHMLAFGKSFGAAYGDNYNFYYQPGDPETGESMSTVWLDEGRSGVVDIEYSGSINAGHLISFLAQDFASQIGYVPDSYGWGSADSKVYANYGAAAMLIYDYYQYNVHSMGLTTANKLNEIVEDNNIGYYNSLQIVADNFNGGMAFNDFFQLAMLDIAVDTPNSTYSAIAASGNNPYLSLGVNNIWAVRDSYGSGSEYLGVTGITPGQTVGVTSGGREYYTSLYLADAIGSGDDTVKITVPASSNADYFIVTPFDAVNVNTNDAWNDAAKVAAKLNDGENTVTIGTNNRFAVLAVNYDLAVGGESFSYEVTMSNIAITGVTTTPEPLVSGASNQKITVNAKAPVLNGQPVTGYVVNTADPATAVSGFTFDAASKNVANGVVSFDIAVDSNVPAGSYSVALTAALPDGTQETVLSDSIIVTVKAGLSSPANGAMVDPVSTDNIVVGFDGNVSPAGGSITIGVSGADYTAALAVSDSSSNSVSVPVGDFKDDNGNNLILHYDGTFHVTVGAGAVVDAYGAANTAQSAGSFMTTSEPNGPSVIPTQLTIEKGSNGNFAVYLGADGVYHAATISGYDESIVSVDTEEVSANGQIIAVTGETTGTTAITIGYSGTDGSSVEKEVSVTVTGEETPAKPSGASTSGITYGNGNGGIIRSAEADPISGAVIRPSPAQPVDKTTAVKDTQAAIAKAQEADEDIATVRVTNASEISVDVMKAMAAEAEKAGIQLQVNADVMEDGKVLIRITFNPANATKDIKLGGSLSSNTVTLVTSRFNNYFSNDIAVISFNQLGGFGMQVHVAAKVELSKLDTTSLVLYTFDRETNAYDRLAAPTPGTRIDKNGYMHYDTTQGNNTVITDQVMTRK